MSREESHHDVFVSYNSADRESVDRVVKFLKAGRLKLFYDQASIGFKQPFLTQIKQALQSCGAALIFQGPHGMGPWQQDEINLAFNRLHDSSSFSLIPVLLPGGKPDPLLATYRQVSLEAGVDDPRALKALFEALGVLPVEEEQGSGPETLPEDLRPYRGLAPFREEDAPYFFGRSGLAARLEKAVTEECFTTLVGLSGSGKTSVIHAGLIPRLRQNAGGTRWEVVAIRPGRHPIFALANALVPVPVAGLPAGVPKSLADDRARRIIEGVEPLGALVKKFLQTRSEAGMDRLLLVVDPWEDLYTLVEEEDEKERDLFIEGLLAETCGKGSPLSLLIACRTDFFNDKVIHYKQLANRLHDRMIHILPMGPKQLREAIEQPLRLEEGNFSFEDGEAGLVRRILNDMEEEPGQLPLLEFVLAELWKRRDPERHMLLTSVYEQLGGIQGALAKRADELVGALDRKVASRLFLQLVEVQEDAPDTRRWAHVDEFDPPARDAIRRLEEERLLVYGRDAKTGALTVELAHESLLRNWPTLQAWLKEKRSFLLWRERLGDERSNWEKNHRQRDFLLRGGPLKEAEHWSTDRSSDLSQEETEYIGKSIQAARRRHTRWRILVASLLIAGAAAVVLSFVSWRQRRAESSRSLAAEALQLKDRGLDVAMLLSLEAHEIVDTTESRSSLFTLLQSSSHIKFFLAGDKQDVYSAVFDPTGRRIASGGGRKIYLWEVGDTAKLVREIDQGDDTAITSIAFNLDGELFLSKAKEAWIRRYTPSGDPLPVIGVPAGAEGIHNLTFSPTDRKLLAYSIGQQVFLRDLEEKVGPLALPGPRGFVSKLAFSPDGRILASADLGQAVVLWRIPDRKNWRAPSEGEIVKLPIEAEVGGYNGLAFNPVRGNVLAIAGGSTIQLWDIETRTRMGMPLHDGSTDDLVVTVGFSPDGRVLASAGSDRKIRLWPFPPDVHPSPLSYLEGHKGTIWSLAFSSDGKVLSGGEGGEVILWDPALPPPLARAVPSQIGAASSSLALDPLGEVLIEGDEAGGIALHDASSGAPLGRLVSPHGSSVTSLAADRKGHVLVSGDLDGKLFLWKDRAPLGEIPLPNLPGASDPIFKSVVTPEGSRGAVVTKSGRIFTLDLVKRQATSLPVTGEPVSALAIDPDGKTIAFASGHRLTFWDLSRSAPIDSVTEAHDQSIHALAFQPGGRLLASGSLDRTIRLWQVGTALIERGGAIPAPKVSALAWSEDGKTLAAGGSDGTIGLWDMEDQRSVGSGVHTPGRVAALAFREDGHLISISGGKLFDWDLRYESWRSYACSLLRRSIALSEWTRYLEGRRHHQVCPE